MHENSTIAAVYCECVCACVRACWPACECTCIHADEICFSNFGTFSVSQRIGTSVYIYCIYLCIYICIYINYTD